MKTLNPLVLLAFLLTLAPGAGQADGLWGSTKAYTGHLAAAADEAALAAAAAGAAVAAAAQEVAARQALVDQLRATLAANPQLVLPAGTLAAAAANLAAAEAALATATATFAEAAAAAKVLAAAAAAWAAGTLVGQGVVWLEHLCWDPVCDWTADDAAGAIYRPADPREVDALVDTLLGLAVAGEVAGVPRSAAELVDLGAPGLVMLDYLRGQVGLLLTYHRGAAAATARRFDEVVAAGEDLQRRLQAVPAEQRAFGALLAELVLTDGRAEVAEAGAAARAALDDARALLAAAQAERPQRALAALIADLDAARASVAALPGTVNELMGGVRLGGVDAYIRPYSAADHDAFRRRCSAGPDCIPAKEIDFLLASMRAAGVHSPALGEDLGPSIAAWDATPPGALEARLLAEGPLTAAVSMLGYAEVDEVPCGFWRGADLGQSPLLIEARPRAGFGDANDDGELDVLDLQRRVNAVLAGEGRPAEDLDHDGAVDVRDVQATVNVILEQPVVGLCPAQAVDADPPRCVGRCLADQALSEGPSRTVAECIAALVNVCGARGLVPPAWLDGAGPTTCLCSAHCDTGERGLRAVPVFETASLTTCVAAGQVECAAQDASLHNVRCTPDAH